MAANAGKVARRMWSSCSSVARNTISLNFASSCSASSPAAAAARPVPRNISSPQQFLGGHRRSAHYNRLPGEIGSISSLIPRHNATAAARLVSKLSNDLTPEIEGILARYVSPI